MCGKLILLAAASMFMGVTMASAKSGNVEGDVVPLPPAEKTPSGCGTHFDAINLKSGGPGGVRFRVNWIVPNTEIRTALSRVSVMVDESKSTPWASVEMDTGMLNAKVVISSKDLAANPCLASAKRF